MPPQKKQKALQLPNKDVLKQGHTVSPEKLSHFLCGFFVFP